MEVFLNQVIGKEREVKIRLNISSFGSHFLSINNEKVKIGTYIGSRKLNYRQPSVIVREVPLRPGFE